MPEDNRVTTSKRGGSKVTSKIMMIQRERIASLGKVDWHHRPQNLYPPSCSSMCSPRHVIRLARQPSTRVCTSQTSSLTKMDYFGDQKSPSVSKLGSLELVTPRMELPQCFPGLCLSTGHPPKLNPSFPTTVFEVFHVWEILELYCRLT